MNFGRHVVRWETSRFGWLVLLEHLLDLVCVTGTIVELLLEQDSMLLERFWLLLEHLMTNFYQHVVLLETSDFW
jgi:hypothetical protein